MFTVLEEDNVDEEEPASEDEEEEDQSPRARLMRGILQDGRPVRVSQASDENNPEDQEEAVRGMEAASEDEEKLEPEKETRKQACITAAWRP